MRRALAAVLVVSLCRAAAARADGIDVQKYLELPELAQTSGAIFTATVRQVKKEWAAREAYGRRRRYVSSFRLQVEVGTWLKGERPSWLKKTVWLMLPGDPPPGKWVIVRELYVGSGFSADAAARGQTIVVFTRELDGWLQTPDGQNAIHPRAVDTADRLQAVKQALAAPGPLPEPGTPPPP